MIKVYDDNPIQKGSEDQYDRTKMVDKLADIIKEKTKVPHSSFTMGIYGSWGEGKTSVLNLLKEQLNEESNIQLCFFNPWILSSQESIVQDFFLSINSDLSSELSKLIQRYGGVVSYAMKGVGYALQFTPIPIIPMFLQSAAKQLDEIRTKLPEREPLSKQKEGISNNLRTSNKHLVIFIDDLDRLDKEELHMVFRLIRQVADFDNVIYVIAMDYDVVTRSLNAYYEDGENVNAGQAFLEKIIQIPILLPRIKPHVLRQYANEELMDIFSDQDLVAEVLGYLCNLFTTKREWNRYLNQLSTVIEFGVKELNLLDVCLIEAIKVIDPKVYAMIGQSKNTLCSKLEVNVGHNNPFVDEETSDIQKEILSSVVLNKRNAVKSIIKQLFSQSFVNEKEKHITKRICSKHYFDKYFVLDVLNDYISDEEIENLRDEYIRISDDKVINSLDSLLDDFSYEEVNRALNMVVVRAGNEDRKNLAVKIMRLLPLCKENHRYDYRYCPMSNHYAMELIINWVPDYLLSLESEKLSFDDDSMENIWNHWCTNAPLPYCMELIFHFNDLSFKGFNRDRLKDGFDILWKRLSGEEYEFAKFSVGYQVTWIREWSRIDDNALKNHLLPLLLSSDFDLQSYLLKNGKDKQEYNTFLSIISDILIPLSDRIELNYHSYQNEIPLRRLVDFAKQLK